MTTVAIYVPPQPKTNIWVTLANLTNQESICLALSSPGNPFSTCLVGLPTDVWPCPLLPYYCVLHGNKPFCSSSTPACDANKPNRVVERWDFWVRHLPIAPTEPQELELLGSVKMDSCLYFKWTNEKLKNTSATVVNSSLPVYRNASEWCQYTAKQFSQSSDHPFSLPSGLFVICGDRAWPGIPSKLSGGPCSLGRLSLLTPNTSMILNMSRYYSNRRMRRSVHSFNSKCQDNVKFWLPGEIIAASFLTPGVASAGALAQLNKLGCWLAKQTNATSRAISDLLVDVDSVRHATLQNRAAIDFLLLAQGHGCDEFEGMCCMNLSDHSVSIHKQLQILNQLTQQLQTDGGLGLEGWLKGLGISPWLRDIIKSGITILIVVLVAMLLLPCIISCLQRMVVSMFNSQKIAMLAFNGNGKNYVI